jgi:glycosyltransferase involved in cell wall biosynthesis
VDVVLPFQLLRADHGPVLFEAMRIVHSILRYPPSSGGAENYAAEIVRRTYNVEAGRDVRVLTTTLRTHGPMSELDPKLLLDDPIYVQRLHTVKTPVFSYPRLQALNYYLGHHKPDIVHSYGFWYQPADVTARYAAKHNIPFIFHPLYYENKIRRKITWQLYKNTIGRKTFALADVVVVISPFEQALIEKAGFAVKRFELIPPGIDLSYYERSRLNPFVKRNITGDIMLSVARVARGKGLEDILHVLPELIKKHPNLQWVIIGEDFGDKKRLNSLAKKIGVQPHMHWFGKVDEEELIGAYQHAAVFVHPSYYEAFGIVLAEASICGCPVVARNVAAIPFVTPHQKSGLLFNTIEEMRQHIEAILTNAPLRRELSHQGKRYISENFQWETSIAKILALYDEFKPRA